MTLTAIFRCGSACPLSVLLLCCAPLTAVSAGDVAVIVNNDVRLAAADPTAVSDDFLSQNALRAIFGMRLRTWPDKSPIRVFVLEDAHPTHNQFAKTILSIFPYQLRRLWDRLVYSGTGQAPNTVGSQDEMRTRVATTPGAIGYLEKDQVDASVRVVEVK